MKLSFKHKLILSIVPVIVVSLMLVGIMTYFELEGVVGKDLSQQMLAKTEQAALSIDQWLNGILSEVETSALTSEAKNVNKSFEGIDRLNLERFKYLDRKFPGDYTVIYTARENADYHGVGKKNGILSVRSGNLSKRQYVKDVMKNGESIFSRPLISTSTGKLNVYAVSPIKVNNKTVGVMGSGISLSRFDELTKLLNLGFGKSGYGIIIAKDGTIIAHKEKRIVMEKKISEIPDPGVKELGQHMMSGKSGIFEYTYKNVKKIAFYTYIPTTGWGLASVVDYDEFFNSINYMMRMNIIAIVAIILIISLVLIFVSSRMLKPLEDLKDFSDKMSIGDLSYELEKRSTDEFGDLADHFNEFIIKIRVVLSEVINMTSDLTSSVAQMADTNEQFTQNAQSQAASAEEVTATIEEVSANMDNIADGAEEQNEKIAQLVSLQDSVDELIKTMGVRVGGALEMTDEIASSAKVGEEAMHNMTSSIEVVEQSSGEVKNIVMIITEISEQINLLSLNAAIEAARAGEMGRGFAVVADEISKLADQTSSSIKDIDNLLKRNNDEIRNSMDRVHHAVEVISSIISRVDDIRVAMHYINELMDKQNNTNQSSRGEIDTISQRSEQINASVNEQKIAVAEIVKSIGNINEMTQSNASGSEELSASSQEISGKVNSLKSQVDFFKIDKA